MHSLECTGYVKAMPLDGGRAMLPDHRDRVLIQALRDSCWGVSREAILLCCVAWDVGADFAVRQRS